MSADIALDSFPLLPELQIQAEVLLGHQNLLYCERRFSRHDYTNSAIRSSLQLKIGGNPVTESRLPSKIAKETLNARS
jgi:hypothetical protein